MSNQQTKEIDQVRVDDINQDALEGILDEFKLKSLDPDFFMIEEQEFNPHNYYHPEYAIYYMDDEPN